VAVRLRDLLELVHHDPVDAPGGGEDVLEVGDRDPELLELVLDLLALETGEALQLQLEDLVGLDLREAPAGDEAVLGLGRRLRSADERDHLVEVVEGLHEAFENVGPRLRLAELVGAPPAHDLPAEVEEELAGLEEVQDL